MRIALPPHHLSIEASADWIPDEAEPKALETYGLYVRSAATGVYLNVRAQDAGKHPLTTEGLTALLREQQWASPPFDEWALTAGALAIVGGTFETIGMGGEVVLEVFVTDGRNVANLAGPGERAVIAAMIPAVKELAGTIRFE